MQVKQHLPDPRPISFPVKLISPSPPPPLACLPAQWPRKREEGQEAG